MSRSLDLTPAQAHRAIIGVLGVRALLDEADNPFEIYDQLTEILGPENADIAALLVLVLSNRVDLTEFPPEEARVYLEAVLDGAHRGLTSYL